MNHLDKELYKLRPRVPRRPHFFGSGKRRRNRHVYQEPEPAKPVKVRPPCGRHPRSEPPENRLRDLYGPQDVPDVRRNYDKTERFPGLLQKR